MSENASLDFPRLCPTPSSSKVRYTLSTFAQGFSRPGKASILTILTLTILATFFLGWIAGFIIGFIALIGKATYDTISTIARQNINLDFDLDFDLNLVDSPVSSYRHRAESEAMENKIWSQLNERNSHNGDSQD